MPHTLQYLLDHADELAAQAESLDPDDAARLPVEPRNRLRDAVIARAVSEAEVAAAVAGMREAGYPWSEVGAVLGTAGESARQRFGQFVADRAAS